MKSEQVDIFEDLVQEINKIENPIDWPDPTEEQLNSYRFNKIWEVIKDWDIAVPTAYNGYCGATGNHVVAIMNALEIKPETEEKELVDFIEQWR
jgi:hypothetical protein